MPLTTNCWKLYIYIYLKIYLHPTEPSELNSWAYYFICASFYCSPGQAESLHSWILRKVWLETGILGLIIIISHTHMYVCVYVWIPKGLQNQVLFMQCNAFIIKHHIPGMLLTAFISWWRHMSFMGFRITHDLCIDSPATAGLQHEIISATHNRYLWGISQWFSSLLWRHIGRYGVANYQPHHCLLNRIFRRRSKKTSKLRVTCLCAVSPVTGKFPAQTSSNAENVSIWWRSHVRKGQRPHKGFSGHNLIMHMWTTRSAGNIHSFETQPEFVIQFAWSHNNPQGTCCDSERI